MTFAHRTFLLLRVARSGFLAACLATSLAAAAVCAGAQGPRPVANDNRVAAHPDYSVKVPVAGHVPAWAWAKSDDLGEAPATSTMHLSLVLSLAPEVQAAWDQLLLDQQNPRSARYHQWLTPEQIGLEYGPTKDDVAAVTDWLQSEGLQVERVAPSRWFVEVSGPASKVASALGTSFHLFAVPGAGGVMTTRRAAVNEPMLPAALVGVVSGIQGLSDVDDAPLSRFEVVTVPARADGSANPLFTTSSGNHYMVPADFATIYDVPSGLDGTGQRIAVIGRSQVAAADINNFQAMVGQAAKLPNVVIPTGGVDPGLPGTADQGEATLDVQRTLGQAPGATVDLIVSTQAAGGIGVGMMYNVQTLKDPVMTVSFGSCEANVTSATAMTYATLFSQAAGEGISVFISSGDSGAAGCDVHGSAPPAMQALGTNYLCSSGFVTCVGGTEFNDPAGYWNATNTSVRESATGYIPEGAWNEPTTTSASGVLTYQVAAGSGGASVFGTKPSFQTGVGVPADGARDEPDVSFSSAQHDGYFGCYANTSGGGSCVVSNNSFSFTSFSGTSAAAPGMAAVTALLNQKMGGAQGNLNPSLYAAAANASNGVFHDVTIATSGVSGCSVGTASLCNNSTPSPTALTGGQAGYLVGTGYDQATGWGSMDVARFLGVQPISTTTVITGGSSTVSPTGTLILNAMVSHMTGTATPTGTVTFYQSGNPIGTATLINGSASYTAPNTLSVAVYQVTAVYSGDASYGASTSAAFTVTVTYGGTTPSATTLTVSANTTVGMSTTFTVMVKNATASGAVPSGSVNFSLILPSGTSVPMGSVVLNSQGVGTEVFSFDARSNSMQAFYTGSTVFATSSSAVVPFTVSAVGTVTALTGPSTVLAGAPATFTANVSGLSSYPVSAAVNFLDGTTLLGSTTLVKAQGAATPVVTFTTSALTTAGAHTITAVYTGDGNTLGSTSNVLSVGVSGITISAASATLTLAAGAATGNTDAVTLTPVGGFSGTVALACTVTYKGTGTPTFAPTCTAAPASVSLSGTAGVTSTVTVSTTLPHAVTGTGARLVGRPELGRRSLMTAAAACGLLAVCLPVGWRRRKGLRLLMMALVAAALMGLAGCGGSSSGGSTTTSPPAPVGTTTGAYSVVVTATGTSGTAMVTTSATIALTVQ